MAVCVAAAATTGVAGRQAQAQTTATISMTAPAASPQIVGATVFSSKPASPLLFTVGATGQSPLSFAATGLPSGVTMSTTGTLAGTTPAAGSYAMTVTVTNSVGSTTGTITLQAEDTLAITPPMGWNSYDSFGSSVTETETLQAAQAMQTILMPHGYRYVVVDYLWFDPQDVIDSNGRFLPSTTRFPSATGSSGFTSLASQVHALGLGFGIHIMRGIPRKAVTANSPIANSTYTATAAANTSDTCAWDSHMYGVNGGTPAGQAWYDSIFAQYASWGIDFVKVDDLSSPYHQAEVDAIHNSIEKTGRSIVFSTSPGPAPTSEATDIEANANQWRIVNDFWDTNGLSSLSDEFTAMSNWQKVAGLSPGHWPDADMLPLGYLGPRCPVHSSGQSALSHNQQVTVMTLWSILPSPLIFGGNVPMLSSDTWTTALLTNDEVLAVNQDSDGKEAKLLTQSATEMTWSRDLSGGRKAVALVNNDTKDATMSVTFTTLGMPAQSTVRDTWQRANVTVTGAGPSITVAAQSAALLVVTPPQSNSADAGNIDAGSIDATTNESGTRGDGGQGGDSSVGASSSGASGSSGASSSSGASGSSGASSSSGSSSGSAGSSSGATSSSTSSSTSSGVSGSNGSSSSSGVGGSGGPADGSSVGTSPTSTLGDSGAAQDSSSASGCSCRLGSTGGADDGHSYFSVFALTALAACSRIGRRARKRKASW